MPIVATAGHVDHGKSTLVTALTGADPDRWDEEKERGLTIDLGFAWTELGSHDVGFVDVPGHERFAKNMLAGVGAIDCAMLVIAADEGWMPQTEEHAAVLDLLEVGQGIIALTRIDTTDTDTVELAQLEVIEEIEGTRLADWPIVPVSSVTGAGIPELRDALVSALDAAGPPRGGTARMWVDRVFTLAGAGTIATGTVLDGAFAPGDAAELWPDHRTVRVRGVQHHGGPVDQVRAGDRAAISFTGEVEDLQRGDLVAEPGTMGQTGRMLTVLYPTRSFDEIPTRGAFHLHVGTASHPVQIRSIRSTDAFVVTSDTPIPVATGDRIVLRDSGRRAVVGGGRVLDPWPTDRTAPGDVGALLAALDGTPDDRATALLSVHGSMPAHQVATATRGGMPRNSRAIGEAWVSVELASTIVEEARTMVERYHQEHPTRPGIPKAELASQLGRSAPLIETLVAADPGLAESGGAIHTDGFVVVLDPAIEADWERIRTDIEATFDVPRLSAIPLDDETVHFLLRRGDLVRIDTDLAFTDRQVAAIVERVAELDDGFTVSEFKDHFGMARRQAVPTLEWLDSIGRTRRSGDGRSVR